MRKTGADAIRRASPGITKGDTQVFDGGASFRAYDPPEEGPRDIHTITEQSSGKLVRKRSIIIDAALSQKLDRYCSKHGMTASAVVEELLKRLEA